jgi:uncharacterized protein with HEPN domain
MNSRIAKYLYDAIKASEAILSFVQGADFKEFNENELLQSAVERKFEIIGESLNRIKQIDELFLNDNITDSYKIIGFRNIIIHGYDIVDNSIVWDAIKENLPRLIQQIKLILENFD